MESESLNIKLLVDGCLRQNRASQRKLYETFYGYGMHISLAYTGSKDEAEEVLNDAFLKVFQHLDRYDMDRPFKAWIRRIIIHTAIDHNRKLMRQFPTIPMDEEPGEATVEVHVPSGLDVRAILQKLSPQYRTVFNLFVLEGMKHGEIAEKLGISVGTSRSNLNRAKHQLKSLISSNSITRKAR